MAFQLHVSNNSHQSHFNKNLSHINHPRTTLLNLVPQQQKFKATSNYHFYKKKLFICQSQEKKIDASKIQFSEKDFGKFFILKIYYFTLYIYLILKNNLIIR